MTLDSLMIFSGAFVALLPFLGLPSSWDTVLFTIVGIFIIGLGISLRRRGREKTSEQNQHSVFMENALRSEHDAH